jgi:hypothetical protein
MPARSMRALLLLAPFTWPLFSQCSLEIATVADFRGKFVDARSGHSLSRNDVVCTDSRIERDKKAKKSSGDYISLRPRQGGQVQIFRCKDQLGCEKPIDLSDLTENAKNSLAGSGLLQSVEEWWNARGRTTTTISGRRSPGSVVPVLKTVIVTVNSPIAVADAFRDGTPAGEYQLDLCAHPTDSDCGNTSPSGRKVNWPAGAGDNLPFKISTPGVYLLYVLKADDPLVRTSDRVLVIVVPLTHARSIPDAREKVAAAERAVPPQAVPKEVFLESYIRFVASVLTSRN